MNYQVSNDQWALLHEVRRVIPSSLPKLNSSISVQRQIPPDFDSTIPELVIPYPHDTFYPITTLKIPHALRSGIIRRMDRLFGLLKQQYASSYRDACRTTFQGVSFSIDFTVLQSVFQYHFRDRNLPKISYQVSRVVAMASNFQAASGETKPPFNSECIPALEAYFVYNGYPTASHRSILARNTMMTPRQIEVWFQNHRNRAKKDGKIVKRLASDLPLKKALNILHITKPLVQDLASSDEGYVHEVEVSRPIFSSTLFQPISCLEVFDTENDPFRPTHAFPTLFSRSRTDLYSNQNAVFKCPPIPWTRKASTPSVEISTVVDVDELAVMFQLKLSFLDRKKCPDSPETSESRPWFSSIVTVLPRGCHPALIQVPTLCGPIARAISNRLPPQLPAGPSRSNILNTFLTTPPMITSNSRKASPLPNRRPTTSGFGATSIPSQSSSRTSSFSSDISSGRLYSSSNNSSPEPSTPPQIPDSSAIYDPSEYVLDEYDFGNLSFLNHPDYHFDFEAALNQPLQDKQPETLDPSLLAPSYPVSNSSTQGYS